MIMKWDSKKWTAPQVQVGSILTFRPLALLGHCCGALCSLPLHSWPTKEKPLAEKNLHRPQQESQVTTTNSLTKQRHRLKPQLSTKVVDISPGASLISSQHTLVHFRHASVALTQSHPQPRTTSGALQPAVAMAVNLDDRVTSSDESSSGADDGEWLDVEPDEEAVTVVSFFDSKTFPSLDEMLAYCVQHYGFDLKDNLARLRLDFLGAVKLVNFVRDSVRQGRPLPSPITPQDIDSDDFLKPVLDNDAVLFSLDDVLEAVSAQAAEAGGEQTVTLQKRNAELEAELEAIQSSFANYRLTVQETLDRRWGDDQDVTTKPAAQASSAPARDNSAYYFESYAFNGSFAGVCNVTTAPCKLTRSSHR